MTDHEKLNYLAAIVNDLICVVKMESKMPDTLAELRKLLNDKFEITKELK